MTKDELAFMDKNNPWGDTHRKIILDLCGGTGSWSQPYTDANYDVRVITLPETDVRTFIPPESVHGILAAPPCTEFSFAKHYHGKGNYTHNFKEGLSIVDACVRIAWTSKPKFWVLENPRGYLKRWMGSPQMIFNPWQFGDKYQKNTCLWGSFNHPEISVEKEPADLIKFSLLKTAEIHPEYIGEYNRTERRAITPKGFAQAFFEANP